MLCFLLSSNLFAMWPAIWVFVIIFAMGILPLLMKRTMLQIGRARVARPSRTWV